MKKILFISDQYINGVIGGSLGHRRFYDILSNEEKYEFKIIALDNNLDKRLDINFKKNRFIDIYTRIRLHSSFLYYYIDEICEAAANFKPDIIIIGRSRLGFITKRLKAILPATNIITNFDNIEFDYVESQFSRKKGLQGYIIKNLEKYIVKRDECDCIKYSNKYIFLSKRDQNRAANLYGYINDDNSYIFPICLKEQINLFKEAQNTNIYFIGNMEYAANVKSIYWFIKEVWIPFYANDKNIVLNIAGKSASITLKDFKNINNIRIYSDFSDIAEIVCKSSLFIAPIQTGAGMKVKIAEALSMGLSILGSDEALVGYEEAEKYLKTRGFFIRANTICDYEKYINNYKKKSQKELELIRKSHIKAFETYYSYNKAKNIIKNILL